MNLITEQVFTQPPYNGCHLKARVVTKNAEKPFYLLIDNEESLQERIVSYFKDNNMGHEDIVRIDYICQPDEKSQNTNENNKS